MKRDEDPRTVAIGGLAGWLVGRLKARGRAKPRLELVERIALAPRQSLALVEAEGRRFLIATSPEGGPVFYALDDCAGLRRSGPVGSGLVGTNLVGSGPARLQSAVNGQPGRGARVSW